MSRPLFVRFLLIFTEGLMNIWWGVKRRQGKAFDASWWQKLSTSFFFYFMLKPSPSGCCESVWNCAQSSVFSCLVQSVASSRTRPPNPQWVMRQWSVGVCEANMICKGKRGRILNQEQAGTLSPRSTKQLCRLHSQLRQVEYGLIKDRRNGNFTQFLQIRGYCFTNSWGFC